MYAVVAEVGMHAVVAEVRMHAVLAEVGMHGVFRKIGLHAVVAEVRMHSVIAVITHQWWLSVSECHKPCSLPGITPRLARIHDHHFIKTFSTGHLLIPARS